MKDTWKSLLNHSSVTGFVLGLCGFASGRQTKTQKELNIVTMLFKGVSSWTLQGKIPERAFRLSEEMLCNTPWPI